MAVLGTMGLAATRKTASAKKTAPPTPALPAVGMTVPALGITVNARDFAAGHDDHATMHEGNGADVLLA